MLAPPMLSHKEVVQGACPRAKQPGVLRQQSDAAYRKHQRQHTYLNLVGLLEMDRIKARADVEVFDWYEWHQACKAAESDLYLADRHCAEKGLWKPPIDTVYRSNATDAQRQPYDRGIVHLDWTAEDWNTALGPDRISELRRIQAGVMSFGSVFSSRLYDNEFIRLFNSTTSSTLRYRPRFWAPACKLARSLRPYVSVHLRGSDGGFKRGIMNAAKGYLGEAASLVANRNTSVDIVQTCSDPSRHCQRCPGKPSVRVLVVTDIKHDQFRDIARAYLNATNPLAKWARQHGFRWQVASTVPRAEREHGNGMHAAHAELLKLLADAFGDGTSAGPGGWVSSVAALLLDVVLASLADFGFVGTPKSTLSAHIWQLNRGRPADMCKALDPEHSVVNPHNCPFCGESPLDFDHAALSTA